MRGADDFLKLSRALKNAGHADLRKELHKGLREGAKPLVRVARQGAAEAFPKGGGLAAVEAKRPFRVQVLTGRDAGVQINARGKYVNLKLLNEHGYIRHPVFADAKTKTRRQWRWVSQNIPSGLGWFDKKIRANAYRVMPDLERVVEDMAERIVRQAKGGRRG